MLRFQIYKIGTMMKISSDAFIFFPIKILSLPFNENTLLLKIKIHKYILSQIFQYQTTMY